MLDTVTHMDALAFLRTLPDASVHCCITSPPYFGLRDYGTDGQIGLEPTPAAYIARLVEVFREVRRVLRDDGTCWQNLGDSYSNDDKWGGATGGKHVGGLHGDTGVGRGKQQTGLKPKDLIGIPWRVAFALQEDGWYLRSDIIWAKGNPMPESVTDRPTKAHEYVFLLTKSPRYWYDADAVREPSSQPTHKENFRSWRDRPRNGVWPSGTGGRMASMTQGRNKRSVWHVNTPKMKLRDDLTEEQRAYVVTELLRRGLL